MAKVMFHSVLQWRMNGAIALCLLALTPTTNAADTGINPQWFVDADKRIDAIRKGPLRVLVLDRKGNAVPDCPVTVKQARHAFPFGVRLSPKAMAGSPSREKHNATPIWRAFNSLSIENVSSWARTQPARDRWDFKQVDRAIKWANSRQMDIAWGGLISADRGRLPNWAAGLAASPLRDAIDTHAQRVLRDYSKHVTRINPFTNTLDHRYVTQQLGVALPRRLFHLTQQSKARATASFGDAFRADRHAGMIRGITKLRDNLIPFDDISVGTTFRGKVHAIQVIRALDALGRLDLNVILNNVEISGDSQAEVAANIERFLRIAFANPHVKGICWAGLNANELNDPTAALLDDDGEPTAAGLLLDLYLTDVWWTLLDQKTDELGNLRARVFAGEHVVTAKLPDGSIVQSTMSIKPGDKEQRLVLQPIGPPKDATLLTDGESR